MKRHFHCSAQYMEHLVLGDLAIPIFVGILTQTDEYLPVLAGLQPSHYLSLLCLASSFLLYFYMLLLCIGIVLT